MPLLERIMLISAVYEYSDIMLTSNAASDRVKLYFLSSSPSSGYGVVSGEGLGDSSVGVETTLRLQLAAQVQSHELTPPTQTSAIVKVECEDHNIMFTWDNTTNTSITLAVLPEFASKVIMVHVHDPDSGTPGAQGGWTVLPALVFVRGPEIVQECPSVQKANSRGPTALIAQPSASTRHTPRQ